MNRSEGYELVREPEGLEGLELAWHRLWEASGPVPPMLEFEWVAEWWRLHGDDGELFLVVAHDQDAVVGIAPLYIQGRGRTLATALRSVMFLGTGEPELEEVCGENAGWLCAPERRDQMTRLVGAALLRHRVAWDRLDLRHLGPATEPATDLQRLLGPVLLESRLIESVSNRVRVAPFEQYVAGITSRSRRARFRKLVRKADAAGLRLVCASTEAEALAMFDRLVELHQEYWQSRGEPGACSSPVFREFQRRMIRHYAETGRLWVFGLQMPDGRRVALHYDNEAGDTLYYYLSGIDYQAASELSPGILMLLHAVDLAATRGLGVLDLMRGEADFKRQLANDSAPMVTLESLATGALSQAWRGLRELRRNLRRQAC